MQLRQAVSRSDWTAKTRLAEQLGSRYPVEMWSRKKPKQGHVAVVLLADPRDGSYAPYYMAQCNCGWFGDTAPDEATAFAEARQHAEQVDPEVRDTLAPDYKPH